MLQIILPLVFTLSLGNNRHVHSKVGTQAGTASKKRNNTGYYVQGTAIFLIAMDKVL